MAAEQPRKQSIVFRVNAKEKAEMVRLSEKSELSLSEWIRAASLAAGVLVANPGPAYLLARDVEGAEVEHVVMEPKPKAPRSPVRKLRRASGS